jgi:hypothetical protein
MQALDFASHRINNASTAVMSNTNINGITFRESLQAIQQHNVTMNNLDVYQQQYNDRRIQYDALVTKMGGHGTMAQQTLPNMDADTDDTSTDPAISSFAAAQDKDIDYPPSEDDNDKQDDSGSMAAEEEGTNLGIDAIDNQDDMGNRGGEEDSSGKIQFAGTLSPALAVGVQLMNVLGKHTTDLSLFDDVAKFVNELASTGHQFAKHVIPTRATIESTCEKTFNYKELKPKLIDVPVSSMSQDTITVPVFDVEAVIQKMLCNPSLMREEHFASNYDIFTGKPSEPDKHSMKAISSQIGDVYEKVTDVRTSCDADGSGKHYITFSRRNNDQTLQMRNGEINVNNVTYNMKVKWLSNKTAGGNKLVDGLFGYIVARSFTSVGYYDKFEIECYTSLKLPNSPETLSDYESTRNTHTLYTINSTRERNDWCMICTQDLDTDESDPTFDKWAYTCPARIHGFFKVITPGVPTPILRQNYSNNLIRNQGRLDDTMYVVVHTNKDFMTWEKLEREFIVPVNLGDINNCTYIFPIDRIVTPLYVFSNHGEVTTNASFFASIPARYWAFHLDYVLNDFTIPGNGGFSQKIVEEDM